MNPQEKAKQLVKKYGALAIDHVQEIINLNVCWWDAAFVRDYPEKYKPEDTYEFWEEVLDEIKILTKSIFD